MKKAYFDVMRIVAIFLVLMNHQFAYKLYYSQHGISEVFSLVEAIIIRVNVPLFAMISGALLLGRDETLGQLWKKRISRILWVILLFTALTYFELGWLRNRDVSFSEFVYGLFAGNLKNLDSYWFLYAYLGFLVMLPFMRKVAKLMTANEFLWLLGIHVLFETILPLANFTLMLCGCDKLMLSSDFIVSLSTAPLMFYPLIGYYINEHVDVDSITPRLWGALAACCALGITLTATVVFTEGQVNKFSQQYINILSCFNVIGVFLLIKKCFNDSFPVNHPKVARTLSFMASLVFGIYLLDLAVQLPVYEQMKHAIMPVIGKFSFSLVWCLTSFVLGGLLTFILKQLPFFKKLL